MFFFSAKDSTVGNLIIATFHSREGVPGSFPPKGSFPGNPISKKWPKIFRFLGEVWNILRHKTRKHGSSGKFFIPNLSLRIHGTNGIFAYMNG